MHACLLFCCLESRTVLQSFGQRGFGKDSVQCSHYIEEEKVNEDNYCSKP